jgi:uncharacterized protein
MKEKIEVSLQPEIALNKIELNTYLSANYNQKNTVSFDFKVVKQTIDARRGSVKVNQDIELYFNEKIESDLVQKTEYPNVSNSKAAIIIGAGPAGMFAALRLIELGIKPILIERGKNVRERRRDLAAINKEHFVNAESNYCFGEGGAGTYSDGKLYTRSKKRGDIRRILEILVNHGASDDILVDAHPHIGTNKLPQVVIELRESIIKAGGEVLFNTKVVDFIIEKDEIKGVITADNQEITGLGVILATGHSARDIFYICQKNDVAIEAKSFAIGVRIEHQQSLIDEQQYSRKVRGILPPASYSIVAQTYHKGIQRGVFSFCMCPGGFIVPSATENGEIVVNGMSPSRRDSRFSNSGLVVSINEPDLLKYKQHNAFAGLEMQREIEKKAWEIAAKNENIVLRGLDKTISTQTHHQFAPAQKIEDFLKRKRSDSLNETSYIPGLTSVDLRDYLPDYIAEPLREGLGQFGQKMKNYASNQGQLIGVESRTSSPIRIPRIKETLEHIEIKRLFPCGEGAGYAGGIVSAAMDGERCAESLFEKYYSK